MEVSSFREIFKRFCAALGWAGLVTLVIFAMVPMMIMDSTGKNDLSPLAAVRIRNLEPPPPEEIIQEKEEEPPPEPEIEMPTPVPQIARPHTDVPTFRPDVSLSAVKGPPLSMPKTDVAVVGFKLGDVDQAPRTTVRTPPVYPFRARNMGIEGVVKVRFLVDATGRTQQITIIEAKPPGVFEDAVIQAVKSWRFEPAVLDGNKVAAWIVAPLQFKLDGD